MTTYKGRPARIDASHNDGTADLTLLDTGARVAVGQDEITPRPMGVDPTTPVEAPSLRAVRLPRGATRCPDCAGALVGVKGCTDTLGCVACKRSYYVPSVMGRERLPGSRLIARWRRRDGLPHSVELRFDERAGFHELYCFEGEVVTGIVVRARSEQDAIAQTDAACAQYANPLDREPENDAPDWARRAEALEGRD